MTRDTDSSSSGPQGRGGAAYPSGTQPYGAGRPFPSLHPQERTRSEDGGAGGAGGAGEDASGAGPEGAAEQQQPGPDEPRTETTLTTRIRINIPGSRPIPPVVVRTAVDESTAAAAASGSAPGAGPASASAPGEGAGEDQDAAAAGAEGAPAAAEPEKKTSDWFSPRKPAQAAQPAPAAPPTAPPPAAPGGPSGETTAAGLPFRNGSASAAGAAPYPPVPGGLGEDEAVRGGHDTPAAGFPSPFAAEAPPFGAGSPFDPATAPPAREGGSPYDTGAGPAAGGPYDPQANPVLDALRDTGANPAVGGAFDTGANPAVGGAFDTGANTGVGSPFDTGANPAVNGPFDTGANPAAADPYDTGANPAMGSPFDTGANPAVGSPFDTGANPAVGSPYDTGANPAADPYDTGANPAVGSPYGTGADPAGPDPYDTGSRPFGTEDFPPGVPRPTDAGDRTDAPFGGRLDAPSGPTAGPATGSVDIPPLDPPAGGSSSDTLVSGIPTVPSAGGPRFPESPRRQAPPFAGAPGGSGPRPPAPAADEPERDRPAPAKPAAPKAAAAKPAKKPRSKAALAGAAVVTVLAVAYGAGLVMNHSDVPKGTTVLGVDIGNQNRAAAAKMLDDALGDRASAPLTLTIGGEKKTLKPSVAGLSIDTDATVQKVAHSDYNPVSVIGSLFGGSRTADPVYVMDEDKLKVALKTLAGSGQAGTEGMVRFEDHKAIAVPGKPGHTFDVDSAVTLVEAAYRTRVETRVDAPVTIDAAPTQPKVTKDDLDKAVNGFGKRAMSGPVVIRTDDAHRITFNKTLPQFLTMTATSTGELAPHIDLAKLKALYGTTFDGVLLERGDGSKTPVTPKDVATALMQGLNASGAGRTVSLQDVV